MRASGALLATLLAAACVAAPSPARADATDECIAQSEAGQRLLLGRKFVESREHLIACGRAECPAPVIRDCTERLRQAEAAMATVLPVARQADGADAADVTVYVDDAATPVRVDGKALDMDPGPHALRFVMPGADPVVRRVTIEEGARLQNVTVVFEGRRALPETVPPLATHEAPAPSSSSSNGQKTLAYVVGGLGIAGLAAGAVLGILAASAASKEKSDCTGADLAACDHYGQAKTDYDHAGTFADASSVAFIAGGAVLATGVVLWLTAPRATTVGLDLAPGGLTLRGAF